MTFSLAELRTTPDEELINRHDELAKTTGAGVSYYLEELARRDLFRCKAAPDVFAPNRTRAHMLSICRLVGLMTFAGHTLKTRQ